MNPGVGASTLRPSHPPHLTQTHHSTLRPRRVGVHRVLRQSSGFSLLIASLLVSMVVAAPPASELLPPTTRGYVSVPDLEKLLASWEETQLGQLARDPALEPFLNDLLPKLRDQLSETNTRFAVTWSDLREVASGEICLASLEPKGRDSHAFVMLVDVSERPEQARQLLGTIQHRMRERGATRSVEKRGAVSVAAYRRAPEPGQLEERLAYVVLQEGRLLATNHPVALAEVLARWQGESKDSLAGSEAFRATLARTELEGGDVASHVEWFIEPLGFARVVRAASGVQLKRGTDMLQVLERQGFDAVTGLGGRFALDTGNHELLHRTFAYAPGERRLAARMLDFPNGGALVPPAWVPGDIANYVSFRLNVAQAFENSKTLVNELAGAGENFFDEFLDNLENDPNGPRVNLRRDLVRHLGTSITVISDCTRPITPLSERFVVAVEVQDTDAVAQTIHQALQADPTACRHEIDSFVVWEIVQEEPDEELTLTVEFSGSGFNFGGAPEIEEDEDSATNLPQSAIAVANGRLLVSSHVEYLAEILRAEPASTLAVAPDYQRVENALELLGAGNESFRIFSRADEACHATYELIRMGRMPESESLFGKFLNRINQADNSTTRRDQALDGSQLPDFEQLRKYLGPAGAYVESFEDGWSITGCLLTR
jgi:hypothetical protein